MTYRDRRIAKAERLYRVGARTFEDGEKMLPCLDWLERELGRYLPEHSS